LIFAATEPLLQLMGRVLLVSPTPSEMPYLWPIWQTNRALAVSAYLVVITVAGLTVIGYQTVQTRYTVAELGPRLVVGFVAANLSWWGCEQATTAANALTGAVLGSGLDLNTAPTAVRQVLGSATGPLWLLLLGGAVEILLTAAVVAAMIRVGIAAVLVVAAPLALALHALPQTDGAARWWWRLYAGVLATQVGQALVLAVGLRVLTTPGALTASPVSALLLLIGLLVIMVRIPFALLGMVQPAVLRSGPSVVGLVSRAYLGYRLLTGARRGGAARGGAARPLGGAGGPGPGPAGGRGPRRRPGPTGGPRTGPGGPTPPAPNGPGTTGSRSGPPVTRPRSTPGPTRRPTPGTAQGSGDGAGGGPVDDLHAVVPPLREAHWRVAGHTAQGQYRLPLGATMHSGLSPTPQPPARRGPVRAAASPITRRPGPGQLALPLPTPTPAPMPMVVPHRPNSGHVSPRTGPAVVVPRPTLTQPPTRTPGRAPGRALGAQPGRIGGARSTPDPFRPRPLPPHTVPPGAPPDAAPLRDSVTAGRDEEDLR
jgi:hypothetical protein